MKFSCETYRDIATELTSLAEANYVEVGHYQDIRFEVDADKYRVAEARGMLRLYTVRDEELIGYAIFFVMHGLHCKGSLRANHDSLYISPEYRSGLLARDFIEYCDAQLKGECIQLVSQSVHVSHNFGPLLKSLGYELVSYTWARRLDG